MIVSRKHFWEVFKTKLVFNLKSEVSRTYLGYLWWLIEPILYVLAMYLVFGIFLNMRTDNFMIFLVSGQVPFIWFSRSIGNASGTIVSGKGLIGQVAIPKMIFPMLSVSQDFVKQAIVFVAMIGFFLVMDLPATIHWFGLIPIAIAQFLLIVSIGMFVAAIVPFFPDFKFLITTGLRLLMYGSGIFYSYEAVVLPKHRDLFLLNPIANLLKNYRDVFLNAQWPDWHALGSITLFSIILITIMYFHFRRHDSVYARVILQ